MGNVVKGPDVGNAGDQCLWWVMPDAGLQGESNWEVCFRNGVVTAKFDHP
jgi:hypothetical protein